jgi:pyrroline-5-carboxylate reductase
MKRLNKKIGIIGCGYMGGAILAGLLKQGIARPSQVCVYDKIKDKPQAFRRRFGVREGRGNADVVSRVDILLLAVKPQDLFEAASEFRNAFSRRHLLITILAGTPIAKVRRAVGPDVQIIRAMPNLGAQVGEAMTALTGAGGKSMEYAEAVFSGCGKTIRLPERHLNLVTAVSGSGPAYFFLLMELLAKEAKTQGLSENVARTLAVQTALGAALLAANSEFPPDELRKQVTSKGGTTEAALKVFEKRKLSAIISAGVRAALKRGRELSRS